MSDFEAIVGGLEIEPGSIGDLRDSLKEDWSEMTGRESDQAEQIIDWVIDRLRTQWGGHPPTSRPGPFDLFVEVGHMEATVVQPSLDDIDRAPLSVALRSAREMIAYHGFKREKWDEAIGEVIRRRREGGSTDA